MSELEHRDGPAPLAGAGLCLGEEQGASEGTEKTTLGWNDLNDVWMRVGPVSSLSQEAFAGAFWEGWRQELALIAERKRKAEAVGLGAQAR